MWSFTASDLAAGAQEKVVAAADFNGPKRRELRQRTNLSCVPVLGLGLLFCGYCVVVLSFIENPSYYKLLWGTSYSGKVCEGLNAAGTPANFLYPLQRNGVGACTNECPTEEDVASVDGHDPADKDKMVCMDAGDFADFSQADEHGITDFSLLKPIDAFRYGVCNYKYRTYQVGRRCYFIDSDVANMFPYKLPTSKVFIFTQSMYASRAFLIFCCIAGAAVASSGFLYLLHVPVDSISEAHTAALDKKSGGGGSSSRTRTGGSSSSGGGGSAAGNEAQALSNVWACIWCGGLCTMLVGSHMYYTAAYYTELAVNPRTDLEVAALRGAAVVLWAGGALWIWVLLRARHAVTLGVLLTAASERCMTAIGAKAVYVLTVWSGCLCTLILGLMTYALSNVATVVDNELIVDPTTSAEGYRFGYTEDATTMVSTTVVVLVTLWACEFVADLTGLATSMSVSGWFFTRDKNKYLPTLFADYSVVLKFHAGTVALGSLLHTVLGAPHRALSVVDSVANARAGRSGYTQSPCAPCEQRVASCTVACLRGGTCGVVDHFLKFTSPNAYAAVAMFGTGYWASAKTSFFLTIRQVHRLGATMAVAQLVPTIGKVTVCATCSALFYFAQVTAFSNTAVSILCSTAIAAMGSWLIAAQFLAPLVQAPQTLLQCYMLDEELFLHNDNERYAYPELHTWVATYGGEFTSDAA